MELGNNYKTFLNLLIDIENKVNDCDETLIDNVEIINECLQYNNNKAFILFIEKIKKDIFNKNTYQKRFFLRFLSQIDGCEFDILILNLYLNLAENEREFTNEVDTDRINFINYFLSLDIKNLNYQIELLSCYELSILFALELDRADLIDKLSNKINDGGN